MEGTTNRYQVVGNLKQVHILDTVVSTSTVITSKYTQSILNRLQLAWRTCPGFAGLLARNGGQSR